MRHCRPPGLLGSWLLALGRNQPTCYSTAAARIFTSRPGQCSRCAALCARACRKEPRPCASGGIAARHLRWPASIVSSRATMGHVRQTFLRCWRQLVSTLWRTSRRRRSRRRSFWIAHSIWASTLPVSPSTRPPMRCAFFFLPPLARCQCILPAAPVSSCCSSSHASCLERASQVGRTGGARAHRLGQYGCALVHRHGVCYRPAPCASRCPEPRTSLTCAGGLLAGTMIRRRRT